MAHTFPGDVCPHGAKLRSGHFFEAGAEGMETPPQGGGVDMGEIRPSGIGFVCISRDDSHSPLWFSLTHPAGGCHGTDVAETMPVRISPNRSAPGSAGQILLTRVSPLTDSAALAYQSLVLRSNIPP